MEGGGRGKGGYDAGALDHQCVVVDPGEVGFTCFPQSCHCGALMPDSSSSSEGEREEEEGKTETEEEP